MKRRRLAGVGLLALAAAIIAGMLLHNDVYWLVVDVLMLAVCLVGGFMLLRK